MGGARAVPGGTDGRNLIVGAELVGRRGKFREEAARFSFGL